MKPLPVQGESKEENVPVEKVFDCYICEDTGMVRTLDEDGSRECPHIKEAKMERDADDAWKEKDTI